MDLKNLDFSGKVIVASTVLAFISLFFNWVDIGFIAANGFSQGSIIFMLVFIYPVVIVLMNKNMKKMFGYICAGIGILLGIIYISSKSGDLFGTSFNAAAGGPYIFIVACVILAFGVFKTKVA